MQKFPAVASILTTLALLLGTALSAAAQPSNQPSEPAKAQNEVPAETSAEVPSSAPSAGRVVVLGFDGADWRTTERMMNAGDLPNLAKLREQGTAGPLVSTDPAESAAGWAAINTGANPVKNGVPSFIERDIAGTAVFPNFAHVKTVTAATDDLVEARGGALSSGGGLLSAARDLNPMVLGGGVFVVAFLVFSFILRAHALLALLIGVALAAAAVFATRSASAVLPDEIPGVFENEVQLDGFWVEAARAGQTSVALQAPMAFARPGAEGARTMYGLGVPDVRSSVNGDWFIYTNDSVETGAHPRAKGAAAPTRARCTGSTSRSPQAAGTRRSTPSSTVR